MAKIQLPPPPQRSERRGAEQGIGAPESEEGFEFYQAFAPESVKGVVHMITLHLKAEGVADSYVFLPFRPEHANRKLLTFLNAVFPLGNGQAVPRTKAQHVIGQTDSWTLVQALKYIWCRLPSEQVIGWDTYQQFRAQERELGYPCDAFMKVLPGCLSSSSHASIVYDFFDLLVAVAANASENRMSARKVAKMCAIWAFGDYRHKDGGANNSFRDGLAQWRRAANAMFHLFLAFMRAFAAEEQNSGKFTKQLEAILFHNAYPPPEELHEDPTKLMSVPVLTLKTDRFSRKPWELFERCNSLFEMVDPSSGSAEDYALLHSLFMRKNQVNVISRKMTGETRRLLKEMSTKHSTFQAGWGSRNPMANKFNLAESISWTRTELSDYFIWAWMSTLSHEQTSSKRKIFGRSFIAELELDGFKKCIIVEESDITLERMRTVASAVASEKAVASSMASPSELHLSPGYLKFQQGVDYACKSASNSDLDRSNRHSNGSHSSKGSIRSNGSNGSNGKAYSNNSSNSSRCSINGGGHTAAYSAIALPKRQMNTKSVPSPSRGNSPASSTGPEFMIATSSNYDTQSVRSLHIEADLPIVRTINMEVSPCSPLSMDITQRKSYPDAAGRYEREMDRLLQRTDALNLQSQAATAVRRPNDFMSRETIPEKPRSYDLPQPTSGITSFYDGLDTGSSVMLDAGSCALGKESPAFGIQQRGAGEAPWALHPNNITEESFISVNSGGPQATPKTMQAPSDPSFLQTRAQWQQGPTQAPKGAAHRNPYSTACNSYGTEESMPRQLTVVNRADTPSTLDSSPPAHVQGGAPLDALGGSGFANLRHKRQSPLSPTVPMHSAPPSPEYVGPTAAGHDGRRPYTYHDAPPGRAPPSSPQKPDPAQTSPVRASPQLAAVRTMQTVPGGDAAALPSHTYQPVRQTYDAIVYPQRSPPQSPSPPEPASAPEHAYAPAHAPRHSTHGFPNHQQPLQPHSQRPHYALSHVPATHYHQSHAVPSVHAEPQTYGRPISVASAPKTHLPNAARPASPVKTAPMATTQQPHGNAVPLNYAPVVLPPNRLHGGNMTKQQGRKQLYKDIRDGNFGV
ncbi:AaceriAAR145Wp [[Ashbya] aceris (nom. inval.)]|nr:AaceriAAR145Wp [[Ashbya] aceris (nom. inval.)]